MSETQVVSVSSVGSPKDLLQDIFAKMGLDVQVSARDVDGNLHLDVSGTDVELARGKKGEVVDALQYLLGKMLPQDKDKLSQVFIDVATFRASREESLSHIANYLREKVLQLKKPISVFPMGSQDRRAIHQAFSSQQEVVSQSEGEGLARRIFVFEAAAKPQKNRAREENTLSQAQHTDESKVAVASETKMPLQEPRITRRTSNPYLLEDELDERKK